MSSCFPSASHQHFEIRSILRIDPLMILNSSLDEFASQRGRNCNYANNMSKLLVDEDFSTIQSIDLTGPGPWEAFTTRILPAKGVASGGDLAVLSDFRNWLLEQKAAANR